jgi:large subunit ribosomal protein L19
MADRLRPCSGPGKRLPDAQAMFKQLQILERLAMNQIIREIEAPLLKDNLPKLNIGDTVKVFVKIKEGGKERTQGYEGVVIKRHGSGVSSTVTVRRVFQGIGIERVFLLHSPRVEKITVQRRGDVRRSKLYYLRERTGKATRIKEKIGHKKDAPVQAAPAQQAPPTEKKDAAES